MVRFLAYRSIVTGDWWTPFRFQDAYIKLWTQYIERDLQFCAAALVQKVHDAADSLADFADRGQTVPEFGDESIRDLLVKPY